MTTVWAVHSWSDKFDQEFNTCAEAVLEAEKHTEVELIKWHVELNLPGLKPDNVYRSLRLYTWRDKQWRAHSIHGYESGSWLEHPMEGK